MEARLLMSVFSPPPQQRLFEKQTSFDKQLDSLTDLLSEMETRGPFNPKVPIFLSGRNKRSEEKWGGENDREGGPLAAASLQGKKKAESHGGAENKRVREGGAMAVYLVSFSPR